MSTSLMLPAVADFDLDYGGRRKNLHPVEDPETDVDADHLNLDFANSAAMTATVSRAWARMKGAATTGGLELKASASVWGNLPQHRPELARTSTGIFTLTWPASIVDKLGATQAVPLRGGSANHTSTTTGYLLNVTTAGNVATLYVRNTSGALVDPIDVDMDVFVI